jgi:hypothetical protein
MTAPVQIAIITIPRLANNVVRLEAAWRRERCLCWDWVERRDIGYSRTISFQKQEGNIRATILSLLYINTLGTFLADSLKIL